MSEDYKVNFIRKIVENDLESKKVDKIITRFPPEPNGRLHIGHAKSICTNFEMAKDFKGTCYLRFDDTNPAKESEEFVHSIQEDIKWLGYDWKDNLTFASDYFDKLYQLAVKLIEQGNAYVCDQTPEQMREFRGTLKEPGKESPFRQRSVQENLQLFDDMKNGLVPDGEKTLRAKIDMSHPNINMRDPVIYRVRKVHHQKTQDKWCIYPMYDFTHGLCDAFEGVTHSLCTLEFEDHRPLYYWLLEKLDHSGPTQIEFAKLKLDYTIVGKRYLQEMVTKKHVEDWDDPRLPTLTGLRRRGVPPQAIVNFCLRIGLSKKESVIDLSNLDHAIREELDKTAKRIMVVLDPIKVTITNYDQKAHPIEAPLHPKDESFGMRTIMWDSEIYIDRQDFAMDPPPKWFRLAPDKEVRLRYGYVIKCEEVITDSQGKVTEIKATYLPETLGGKKPAHGKKVKGIIHWVSAKHSTNVTVALYDRLFSDPKPKGEELEKYLNKNSLELMPQALGEESIEKLEGPFQFERLGYFTKDPKNGHYNRTVTLKDTWTKQDK